MASFETKIVTEWTVVQWGCAPQVGNATQGAETHSGSNKNII